MLNIHRPAIACLLLLAAPWSAAKKDAPAPTAPGVHTDWSDRIDRVEILESFKLDDYREIRWEPAAIDAPALLASVKDKIRPKVQPHLAVGDLALRSGIQRAPARVTARIQNAPPAAPEAAPAPAPAPPDAVAAPGEAAAPEPVKFLRIRTRVTAFNPGSQAARYWVGMGAGKASGTVEGEILDGESGRVLVRFTQTRLDSAGAFGGDYEHVVKAILTDIGEDVGALLAAF